MAETLKDLEAAALRLPVDSRAKLVQRLLASLDPGHQIDVMEMLRGEAGAGAMTIAVLHDLTMAARYCDRLLLLDGGAVVAEGPPAGVLTPDLLRQVYGIDARVETGGNWPTVTTFGRVRDKDD